MKRLVEISWLEAKATEWEVLDVGPYYDPKVKQMVYPCQIVKMDGINSNGEVVPGSGVQSAAIPLPSGGMAAVYGGHEICNAFQNKLKNKGLETHIILAEQKLQSFDGRSEGNWIFDPFFYARTGTVSLNCKYAC